MALYCKKLVRKPTRFGTDALEQYIRNVIKEKATKHNSGTPQGCIRQKHSDVLMNLCKRKRKVGCSNSSSGRPKS